MWAHTITAPYSFVRLEVPAPTASDLGEGEVLLRVLAGGICGSDLPAFTGAGLLGMADGGANIPGAPLHEVVGEVIASRDADLVIGARVVGWASARNAIAEYIVADGAGLYEYDARLAPETAVLLQPLACVIYALQQLTGIDGARAAVIGLGPIGVLFGHVLRAQGAAEVVGIDKVDRSDVAKVFGLDDTVQLSAGRWVESMTDQTRRPDLVIEAVGHQVTTLGNAVDALADSGQIYYFGIPDDLVYPFPMTTFLRKNARLASGSTRNKRAALADAAHYLRNHPELETAYITHVLDFEDVQRAFELAIRPAKGQLKIVLRT